MSASRPPLSFTSPRPFSLSQRSPSAQPQGSLGRRRLSLLGQPGDAQVDLSGSARVCGCGWKWVMEFTLRSLMGRNINH